jgi:uncharacterized protein involved in copper resistance
MPGQSHQAMPVNHTTQNKHEHIHPTQQANFSEQRSKKPQKSKKFKKRKPHNQSINSKIIRLRLSTRVHEPVVVKWAAVVGLAMTSDD